MKHSYSRLSRYIRCPLSYKLEYLDKLPTVKSNPMILGGLCHDFFEAYDRHLAAAQLPTDISAATRIMEQVFQKFERPVPPEIYEEFHTICRSFVENHVLDLASFVGAESQIAITRAFTLCDWNADDAWFRFKLDRLDKVGVRAVITDYKTGWGGEADPFQLLLYACAVWILNTYQPILPETGDLEMVEVVLCYNRSGRENRWIFTREKIEDGFRKMVEYAERVEQEKAWKPTPGTACRGCSFAGTAHCPVQVGDMNPITTDEDAARAALELVLLDAQRNTRKSALKDWCRDHGPVSAQADVFDFGQRESYEVINPIGFVKALEKAGYDPVEFYAVATTEIKKRCQKDPNLADLIAPYIFTKTAETFGHRAAPKRDPFSSTSTQATTTTNAAHKGDTNAAQKVTPPSAAAVDAALQLHAPRPDGTGRSNDSPPAAVTARPGLSRFSGASSGRGGDRPADPGAGVVPPQNSVRPGGPARFPGAPGAEVGQGTGDPNGRGPGGGSRRPF